MELIVKGTPEELAEWLRRIKDTSMLPPEMVHPDGKTDQTPASAADDAQRSFVEYIKLVLRPPLSERTKQFIVILYEAGDVGINRSEVARKMGLSSQQMQGITGPLGKRAYHTPGHDAQAATHYPHSASGLVLEYTKLDDGDWHYRLWPESRQAWKELNQM